MKQHQKSIGLNDEWITPPEIVSALGYFDLDPCAAIGSPYNFAREQFTVESDGLKNDWFGRVWLNPPFNRNLRPKFMDKMAEHNNGIMLVPAACETEAFRKYVWGNAKGILFLNTRPHFYYIDGSMAKANSGCTICLVAYGYNNLQALVDSDLGYVVTEYENNTNF